VIDEGRIPDENRVRYEMFQRLGYFVTESSEHFSEYAPWFIKANHPDLIGRYNIPLDEYLYRCEAGERSWAFIERELETPGSQDPEQLRARLEELPLMASQVEGAVRSFANFDRIERSVEFGSTIIHSMETGAPAAIYGNVVNAGLIDNLPADSCVEVPCLVDRNGVQPTRIGALPPQLAALMQTNINVQTLTVEAILTGERDHVYHAAMLDPHTSSELTLDQIWSMVDDLIEAHGEYIPENLRHRTKQVALI
jgi:alpha-galactosidase